MCIVYVIIHDKSDMQPFRLIRRVYICKQPTVFGKLKVVRVAAENGATLENKKVKAGTIKAMPHVVRRAGHGLPHAVRHALQSRHDR